MLRRSVVFIFINLYRPVHIHVFIYIYFCMCPLLPNRLRIVFILVSNVP